MRMPLFMRMNPKIPLFLAVNLLMIAYRVYNFMTCVEPEWDTLTTILVWMNLITVEQTCPRLETIIWEMVESAILRFAITVILFLGKTLLTKLGLPAFKYLVKGLVIVVLLWCFKVMEVCQRCVRTVQLIVMEMALRACWSFVCVYVPVCLFISVCIDRVVSAMRAYVSRVWAILSYASWICSVLASKVLKWWNPKGGGHTSLSVGFHIYREAYIQSGEVLMVGVFESRVYIVRFNKDTGRFQCIFLADTAD